MKNVRISILMTIATTVLLGLIYPMVVTGLAQWIFPRQANGELIRKHGDLVGSALIAQGFFGPEYFHSRPSAAGNGWDAANSGGSNYGPTNQKLLDRVKRDVAADQADAPGTPVPIDLVTTSASGLDPDLTPASAEFQLARVAKERGVSVQQLRSLLEKHTQGRQFGFLGEARVNVLELNLDLDQQFPLRKPSKLN